MHSLFSTKPLDALLGDTERPEQRLKRTLGPVHLTFLGIGAIVGAGIFSLVGTAAAGDGSHLGAGPALIVSFVLVAIACGFAALCYAEFAAMVPVAGSAYTYAYATLGQLVAWIIGWDLILEYAVGNIAVAISWSEYFQTLCRGFHFEWPVWLGVDYRTAFASAHQLAEASAQNQDLSALGDSVLRAARATVEAPHLGVLPIIFNLLAFGITMAISIVLSGVVALTLTPVLCAMILKSQTNHVKKRGPLAGLLHLPLTNAAVSHIQLMIFGGLIIFFLIVEPHGLARLWQIAKEKLRLWPFPH